MSSALIVDGYQGDNIGDIRIAIHSSILAYVEFVGPLIHHHITVVLEYQDVHNII